MSTKALREKRANLITEMDAIRNGALADGRDVMNEEENTRWDKLDDDVVKLSAQIEKDDKHEERVKSLEESRGTKTVERTTRTTDSAETRAIVAGQTDRAEALRAWFVRGSNETPAEPLLRAAAACKIDLNSRLLEFRLAAKPLDSWRRDDVRDWEARALTTTVGSSGQFSIPDEAMRELEIAMLRFGGMRQAASIVRTSTGAPLPWPTSNDTANKGEILAENTQVSQQDVVFGQLILDAFKYSSKMILVPVELLQDSSVNIPEFLGQALGTRIGRITNDHFTTGTGTGQPRGIVTAATVGKTGLAGQVATVIYNDLVDLEHSVDPDYRQNARWMMSDAALKVVKKLVDGSARPLWQPALAGIAGGAPDTILGYPYIINQSMAVPAASAKSILFGDISKYKIRDVRDVTLMRLDERFADFHQVAFLAFSRHDGDLLDAGTNPVKVYAHPAA